MVSQVVDIFIYCFYLLTEVVFLPVAIYYDLIGLILGIFLTFTMFRFVFVPLVGGASGFSKFFGSSGSDRARKRKEE